VIGALTVVALARLLTPIGYGLYSIVFSIVLLANMLSDVGISSAVIKYASETETDQDIVWTGFIIDSALSILAFAACLLLANPLQILMGKPIGNLILLCSLYLIPCCFDIFSCRLQARRRIELFSTLNLAYTILCAIFSLGLVLLGFGLAGAIVGYVAAKLVTTILFLHFGWTKGNFNIEISKKLLKFGVFTFISSVSWYATSKIDRIFLGFYVPSLSIGLYSAAQGLAEVMMVIPLAFVTVAFPIISRAHARNDFATLKKTYEMGVYGCGVYAVVATFIGLALAWPLIRWTFGRMYLPSIPIFQVCILASTMNCLEVVNFLILNAIGKPDLGARINASQAAIMIISLPTMISWIGVIGAAIVDVLVHIFGFFSTFIEVRRVTGLKPKLSWSSLEAFFKLLFSEAELIR
jgi:O-antigen/teichoic acid export membrane protein